MMVAMIAGAAAFTAGAGLVRSLWMTLAGWFLAVGGFSLDSYADRELDIKGPRAEIRHNPLADVSLFPPIGLACLPPPLQAKSLRSHWPKQRRG
jgi:4-hydroxybenzoate polyprenyltransferase